ncbi:hypothetical protein QT971_05625 [Microcoleus sp. herbarium19]|uniref:hypothetical protein n=1 Tax=unclassified Microcoleus TaxID=2642155 RepID=UPI002FD60034
MEYILRGSRSPAAKIYRGDRLFERSKSAAIYRVCGGESESAGRKAIIFRKTLPTV